MANIIIWTAYAAEHAPIRTAGAYQIASWLRQHGYSVKVIDFCHLISADDLVSITENYIDSSTVAVGVSSTFWDGFWGNWLNGLPPKYTEPDWLINARELLEKRKPQLKWVLGGSKSVRPNNRFEWVKFHSFAEDSILKWMDENSGKFVRRDLFDIKNASKSYSHDDFIEPQEVLTLELGRGCMFKCKFCSYPLIGKKPGTYTKDFSYIRDEFVKNYETWGTTKYYFQDDTVNESPEKIEALANMAASLPFKLEWTGYIRLDLVNRWPDMASQLKQSGLRSAYFGIESFHPSASMAVGKGWNGKKAKDYLLYLKEFWGKDINWYLSLIVGLPGETSQDLQSTMEWCIENDMYDWHFFALNINCSPSKYWKSEFENNYQEYGYSFPDPENKPFHWVSDLWKYETAFLYSNSLNTKSQKHCKPSAWLLSELVSHGYSYDELMHTPKSMLPWNTFKSKTKEFVNSYVEKHKKI